MAKKSVTTRTGRFMKLAGMTASVAGRYASEKVRSTLGSDDKKEERLSKTYDKMANDIVSTLGELKGAVMKVGQIASQTQDFLPKEFSAALQKLQKEAPPMDFSLIRQQIIDELGDTPETLFDVFDEQPYAAASIGQVHRAKTKDGREVIVKVQYPGVDKSCDSDLKQLRMTLKLGGLLKIPKESVDQLFQEILERLHEELDYQNEARNIKRFQAFHKDDPGLIIPTVIDELSTRRVLTLELVEGDHLSELDRSVYTQEVINLIGHRIFTTMADQLFKFQCIHGDPHAGNFAFRPDGTVIMYDFGCVKQLKPEIVTAYKAALNAGIGEDYQLLDKRLIDLGVRVEGKPALDEGYYAMWRDIFISPFEHKDEIYDFAQASLHTKVASKAPTVFKHLDSFKPPVESLFIDRLIAGHYWMMKNLGVQAAFRNELEEYLK
ncbi:ABC1 kinase family protein [Alkalimarinus sediminis]|uniref:AarF/ABC1/UbiB kinase family protein n=1 Tax=Alkalimarinus sediminis TaxID=1632866 RepID=A0A9E8HFG7_9ALTE|nr:AarF/ABC1/UbiB kinase family protein [Alkalimarinus sediminis]UZW73678.1 AarF/ABC1/UbiB kinase family protein [Alkalimarinus sediminis]